MIKKVIIALVCVWLCFILQSTILSGMHLGNTVPNLLIIITACFGFMEGDLVGLIAGFACGALMDVFYGSFYGLYAIIYMYIGYMNGKFCNIFYPEDVKLPLGLIIVSDLMYGLSVYVLLFLLRGRFNFGYYFGRIIIPEIISTIILTLITYPVILFVHKKIMVTKQRSYDI